MLVADLSFAVFSQQRGFWVVPDEGVLGEFLGTFQGFEQVDGFVLLVEFGEDF